MRPGGSARSRSRSRSADALTSRMTWWQTLLATASGVVLAALFALLQDRLRSKREASEAVKRLEHERFERRYQDRLEAYSAFVAETHDRTNVIDALELEGASSDLFRGEDLDEVFKLWGRIDLIGSEETRAAAENYYSMLFLRTWGVASHRDIDLSATRAIFIRAARKDLGIPDIRG